MLDNCSKKKCLLHACIYWLLSVSLIGAANGTLPGLTASDCSSQTDPYMRFLSTTRPMNLP